VLDRVDRIDAGNGYDSENPFFAGCGTWPGWPAALQATLSDVEAPVRFAAVSWQELLSVTPLDSAALGWASQKHALHARGEPSAPG
jgi:hypothetical protein